MLRTQFSPRNIGSLRMWLDASVSSSLFDATTGGNRPANNGGIGRWEDLSGNGFHVTQGTANNRPQRRVQDRNGLDGVAFDGSNDFLFSSNAMFTNKVSIFFASKAASSTARFFYCDFGNYTTRSFGVEQNTFNTQGSRWGLYLASTGVASSVYDTTLATSTNVSVVSVVADTTTGGHTDTTYAVNGTLSGAFSRRNGTLNTWFDYSTSSQCMIGAINNNGTGISGVYLNGTLYEVVAFNTNLSTSERKAVERYLGNKWGVAVA